MATLITLTLSLVLAVAPATAAPKGSQIKPSGVTSLVSLVSPGQPGAFQATFENTGSATITDLGFRATLSGGTWDGVTLPSGCSTSGPVVTCALGSFAGDSTPVSLLFLPIAIEPTDESGVGSMSLSDASFRGDASKNNKQAASFDTWPLTSAAAIVDTNAEVFGKWQQPHPDEVPFDEIGTGFQRTQVNVVAGSVNGYAVFVGHANAPVSCTSGDVAGEVGGFGRAIDVTVNGGNSPIDITIQYSAAALGNTPASQIDLLHERNGACVNVLRDCAANAGSPAGCFDVIVAGRGPNQTATVVAQLPNNGRVKGY